MGGGDENGDGVVIMPNDKEGKHFKSVDDDEEEFDDNCGAQIKRLRYSTWCVLMTELCERFSYYGIKSVLVLYFTQSLFMSMSRGKAWYHIFSSLSYFTGVIGAVIADSWLGKYKTILISLIVYAIFQIILTLTSVPDIGNKSSVGPLISLIFIACACGNIKPCLGSFGGDQVNKKDVKLVTTFFSMFYMSVNIGACFVMIFAPMIRTDFQCYGADCYTAVFGIMAFIMVLAGVSFIIGTRGYVKRKPEGNMAVQVSKIIFYALDGKRKASNDDVRESWLYHAEGKFGMREIDDVRGLLKVLVLYIPLPIYWALFHQQGSSWTLQAEQMDGAMGTTELRSDQIQFFNPVLVLILIPLFDIIIYPLFKKCGMELTSLQKMTAGMFLSAVAFVITGLIQLKIQGVSPNPPLPPDNFNSVDFINVSPCQFMKLKYGNESLVIPYGSHSGFQFVGDRISYMTITGSNCYSKKDEYTTSKLDISNVFAIYPYNSVLIDINNKDKFVYKVLNQSFPRVDLKTSDSRVRILYIPRDNMTSSLNVMLQHPLYEQRSVPLQHLSEHDEKVRYIPASKYSIETRDNSSNSITVKNADVKFHTFGEHTVLLHRPMHEKSSQDITVSLLEDVKGTSVHRIWQLPQYIVITAGEILFSVTGLEFAYSQAPQSMKSVLQSLWMLTTAFGDIFVVFISLVNPVDGIAVEMFLYSGIMVVVMIIFMVLCYFYTYNDYSGRGETAGNAAQGESDDRILNEETKMLS